MWRPTAPDLVIVLGAVAVAGALTVSQDQGLPELLFYSVLLVVLAWVARLAIRSARLAEVQRRRAGELAALRPADAALAAVRDERRRLSVEIAASLREALVQIRSDASTGDVDAALPARLGRIHDRTQQATSDLRRHLGLLRAPLRDPGPQPPVSPTWPSHTDLLLAAAVTVLAVAEAIAYPLIEGWEGWLPGSVPVTALAAATVVGRRVALGPAVLSCAAIFLLGTLLGAPVVDGFWTLGSVGVLCWTVGARARTPVELGGGLLLAAAVMITRAADTPDNLFIAVVIVSVSVFSGLLVRTIGAGGERASRRAAARERELGAAARTAVDAERAVFARELHDVASHAVGVIALQAGAASVSWERDPDGARRALEVITATADSALVDLARLQPGAPSPRTVEDLHSLVDRIRATGADVAMSVEGDVPPGAMHVVHRIVQECLTNVLRHAPGSRAEVRVRSDPDGTTVTVVDDGPGVSRDGRRGYGLIGLSERVGFTGGSLEVGPGPAGTGFRVSARLPAQAPAVTS